MPSTREKFILHLRSKPYITNKNLTGQIQHLLRDLQLEEDNKLVYLFDPHTRALVPPSQVNSYLTQKIGHLFTPPEYVREVRVEQSIFHFIIVNYSNHDYLTIREFLPHRISYTPQKQPILGQTFHRKNPALIFYDNLSIKRQLPRTSNWIDIPINEHFDEADGNLLLGMDEFILVRDFMREFTINRRIPAQLTYSEILSHRSRLELITSKWKTSTDLAEYVNLNKLLYWEINVFRELKTKITDAEFRRVLGWYHQAGRKQLHDFNQAEKIWYEAIQSEAPPLRWENLYSCYLADRFSVPLMHRNDYSGSYFIIRDYLTNHREARKGVKLEVTARSWNRFCVLERVVGVELQNKTYKGYSRKRFNRSKKWKPLLRCLNNADFSVTHLDNAAALIDEGNRQGNCVGSYISKVANDECLILSVVYAGQNHTVEVTSTGSSDNPKYQVVQCLRRFNKRASPGAKSAVEKLINQ